MIYFVEKIIEYTNSDGNYEFQLVGIKAKIKGNHISALMNMEPHLKPIVKRNMHRHKVNSLPGVNLVTCVNGGELCVILFKKNQYGIPD